MEHVVVAKSLYKKFRKGSAKTLKDLFNQFRPGRKPEEFWALKEVSFEVQKGDTFGIIGRNGSGKSTLLKLISRIMVPTKGSIVTHGRIAPLIELGAGFHGDLTGRENIFLNGAILGMKNEEIRRKFEDIVEFSGIREFIDTPVKHYSSGMYARLGFSIAIHSDPEILIVDEVLAVGDIAFQEKCYGKINELKKKGVTIIIVSHSNRTIERYCNKAIWLDQGRIRKKGSAEYVVQAYREEVEGELAAIAHTKQREGKAEIRLTGVEFYLGDRKTREFRRGDTLKAKISYVLTKPIENPIFGIVFFTESGFHLSGYNTRMDHLQTGRLTSGGNIEYLIDGIPFHPGTYLVTVAVFDKNKDVLDWHDQAYRFSVVPVPDEETNGTIRLKDRWVMPQQEPLKERAS